MAIGQPAGLLAGQLLNAFCFFFGLGNDAVVFLLDALSLFYFLGNSQHHLVNKLETALGIYEFHFCAGHAPRL
jgi:hypothetical protein